MKAIFSTNEVRQPMAAPRLFRALCRALQPWRTVPSGAASTLRRRDRRAAHFAALSDFELHDIGLRGQDIKAWPSAIARSPGDADAAR